MKNSICISVKKLIILAALFLCPTFIFASIGIGAQGGWNFTNAEQCIDASLSLKFSKTPFTFTLETGVNEGYLSLGLATDYWHKNPTLTGMIRYYFGPGLTFSFSNLLSDAFEFYIGARFVTGLNVFLWTPLEVYLQSAFELGFSTTYKFTWYIPLSLGTRVWF